MRESIGERKCSAKPECGESDTGAVSFQGGDSIHKVNESKKKTKSKKQPER